MRLFPPLESTVKEHTANWPSRVTWRSTTAYLPLYNDNQEKYLNGICY